MSLFGSAPAPPRAAPPASPLERKLGLLDVAYAPVLAAPRSGAPCGVASPCYAACWLALPPPVPVFLAPNADWCGLPGLGELPSGFFLEGCFTSAKPRLVPLLGDLGDTCPSVPALGETPPPASGRSSNPACYLALKGPRLRARYGDPTSCPAPASPW